jgi:predicted MFS family arabinose efflux permease
MIGAGQGYIMTPLLNLVLGFVDEADSGMASGVVSTVQQVGAALGVAVVGILFNGALAETTLFVTSRTVCFCLCGWNALQPRSGGSHLPAVADSGKNATNNTMIGFHPLAP